MGSTHGIPGRFAPEYQPFMQETARCCGSCGRCLFAICAQRCIIRQKQRVFSLFLLSPSSRRAWIEMRIITVMRIKKAVALLAEGVDRNAVQIGILRSCRRSPSSRRAWIEIFMPLCGWSCTRVALLAEGVDRNDKLFDLEHSEAVALLAEGVDRNWKGECRRNGAYRRPPRGGRG